VSASLAARYFHCGINHEATKIMCRVIPFTGVTNHTIDLLTHQFLAEFLAKIDKEIDSTFEDSRIDLTIREASTYTTNPGAILIQEPGR
jgi:hypothetical protein